MTRDDESWLPRPLNSLGGRLALVVDEIGSKEASQISGKSFKQLRRYCAGAEPPFGVLLALVQQSGISFDWLALGTAKTTIDHELYERGLRGELVHLEAALGSDLSPAERTEVLQRISATNEQLAVTREILSLRSRGAANAEAASPLDLQRLVRAVRIVELGLAEAGRGADPTLKAELILAAYELLPQASEEKEALVMRLVKG